MSVTISTPSPREIRMVRAFAAQRERIFAALTEPELLKNWYGAKGWWLTDAQIDLRVGGAWRFVSAGPGGVTMASGGVYREITPPSRLVYTERFDDQWYTGESLVTAELTGATTLTTTLLFETREIRDHVLRSPMERGLGESYARLDTLISERTEP